MNGIDQAALWWPDYPKARDKRVELDDCELETMISNRQPTITVTGEPLDAPACFWTDPDHIYLRVNWEKWCTVSKASPDHVAALRAAHYCHINHSLDNEITDVTAPVYHIGELPRELFPPPPSNVASKADNDSKKKRAIASLNERVLYDCDVMGFTHVMLEGEVVDLAVYSDDAAVLFAVYPEDEDFVARAREEGASETTENAIPATILDTLVRQREIVQNTEPDAELHLAIIASMKTLASMRKNWSDELEEKAISLVAYPDFEDFQRQIFSSLQQSDDE